MVVYEIETRQAFDEAIRTNKVVLVDFFATWCAPCKAISPVVAKFSEAEKYRDVYFAKIDVEKLSDLADELKVMAMPTFLIFRAGDQVGELLEPLPEALTELLEKEL